VGRLKSIGHIKYWCTYRFLGVMSGHVHVLVLCPPRHFPVCIVNYLKGESARQFPCLNYWLGRLRVGLVVWT
jgi:REP element-mobilizing transposase RayT